MLEFEKFMQLYGITKAELPIAVKSLINQYSLIKKTMKEQQVAELDKAIVDGLIKYTQFMSVEQYKEFKKTGEKPKSKEDIAKEKSELEAKEKSELEAKEKSELEAKEKSELEAKEKLDLEAKEKSELEAKEKLDLEAKEKSDKEKQSQAKKKKARKTIWDIW